MQHLAKLFTLGVMNVVRTPTHIPIIIAAFGSSGSPVTTKQFDYVVQDGNVTVTMIGSIAM